MYYICINNINMSDSCGKNQIRRKSYTRKSKSGKKVSVKAACINATSQSGLKRSVKDKKIMAKKKKMHEMARDKFGTPTCEPPYILREGYYKKGYKRGSYKKTSGTKVGAAEVSATWVEPVCIKSRTGRPHGKQLFVLNKGDLKPYGYENVKELSVAQRHNALKRALNGGIKPLSLYRKINALSVLTKNDDPTEHAIFEADKHWIQSTPEYMNRSTGGLGRSKKGSKKGSKKVSVKRLSADDVEIPLYGGKKRSSKKGSKGSKKSSKRRVGRPRKSSKKGSRKGSKKASLSRTDIWDEMDQWGGKKRSKKGSKKSSKKLSRKTKKSSKKNSQKMMQCN